MQDPRNYENVITFEDVNPLDLYGVNNEKLNLVKHAYPNVKFVARGHSLKTMGQPEKLKAIEQIMNSLLREIRKYGQVDNVRVKQILEKEGGDSTAPKRQELPSDVILRGNNNNLIRAKTDGQRAIVSSAKDNDLVFAIGPAGTGKTYTAVAVAVNELKNKKVKKIILVRPAVEAGEQLGFLPGDLKDKIDPYLRPLYDGLEDMIPPEKLELYMERGIIEIAPLAYMRGRTLNKAFIILDEAQNATRAQLKMFLTRLGNDSKIIVTGDATQIDLPSRRDSGLIEAERILKGLKGVGFVHLDASDVVRHPLVRRILGAYEKLELEQEQRRLQRSDSRKSTDDGPNQAPTT
ncbi:MAG: PhoH family protein [Bacteroidota bacterium]